MTGLSEYVHILTALFVIVNPIGAIPLFITFTREQSPSERLVTAKQTAIAVAVVLVVTLFIGEPLLHFFGIGLPSFRVGGGILILLMAISMLHARQGGARNTLQEVVEAEDKENVAVVPLAIPMLAGPGAISTTIIYAHRVNTVWGYVVLLGIVLLVAFGVMAALRLADPISQRLGRTGINIATRIMGLILAAISIEFIAGGLLQLFPHLA